MALRGSLLSSLLSSMSLYGHIAVCLSFHLLDISQFLDITNKATWLQVFFFVSGGLIFF